MSKVQTLSLTKRSMQRLLDNPGEFKCPTCFGLKFVAQAIDSKLHKRLRHLLLPKAVLALKSNPNCYIA